MLGPRLRCGQAGFGKVLYGKVISAVIWYGVVIQFLLLMVLCGQGSSYGIYHEITRTAKNPKQWRK